MDKEITEKQYQAFLNWLKSPYLENECWGIKRNRRMITAIVILGIVIGILFTSSSYIFITGNLYTIAKDAIANCELNILRSQRCIIIAIPEENK